MYVYHYVFGLQVGRLLPLFQHRFHSVAIGGFVYVVVALVGTIIAAVLSYELYERRWLKLKSKFAGDEAKPAPAAS